MPKMTLKINCAPMFQANDLDKTTKCSKKSCPIVFGRTVFPKVSSPFIQRLTRYDNGQDFLDIQYVMKI